MGDHILTRLLKDSIGHRMPQESLRERYVQTRRGREVLESGLILAVREGSCKTKSIYRWLGD